MNSPRYAALSLTLIASSLHSVWAQNTLQTKSDSAEAPTVVISVNRGVAQKAEDTPASIDVISGDTLRTGQAGVNVSETLVRVPGVVANNRQNYAQDLQISIRGYGARAAFGVRGLRLYTDGIPASGPDGQGQVSHFDLASASRVEVLRGPFSALYGNSAGGVISMFTADGGRDTVAEISSVFGSNNVQKIGAQLSGTQGQLQYNISANRFSTDGARDHSSAKRDNLNSKFKYHVSDDTKLSVIINSVNMPNVQDPLGLTRAELDANPNQATANALKYNTRKSVKQNQLGVVLDHRIEATHKVQVTAYAGNRQTEQFQSIVTTAQTAPSSPGGVIDLERNYQGFDARWINTNKLMDRPLTLTVGASTDTAKEARRGYQNFVGTALGVLGALRRDETNKVRSFDQYIQADWAFSDRWSMAAGLRHSEIAFESQDNYIVAGNGDDSGSVKYAATNPALGVVFHMNDATNWYATYGKGFETPTLSELSYRPGGATGLNFNLQSAKSKQWEAGVKTKLSSNWRLNAAYFQARTNDEIVVAASTGGRTSFQNAGTTQRDGIEVLMTGNISPEWQAHLAFTQINAVYGSEYANGGRMPGIPKTSLFSELAYKPKSMPMFEAALEWRYVDSVFVNDQNNDATDKAQIFALRLSESQKFGSWTFKEFLRIDNLTDRRHVGSVIVNETNGRYFEPAPGRTWMLGVNASYKF